MNPTLYDILGVRPDATPEEIKRAWRDAADRFEPGAGSSGAQFRLFNEAAEVLLDPAKRKEYDAGLAGSEAPDQAGPAVVDLTKPKVKGKPKGKDRPKGEAKPPSKDEPEGTAAAGGALAGTATAVEDRPEEDAAAAEPAAGTEPGSGGPSTLVLGGLGALALVLVVVAAVLGLVTWSLPDVRHQDQVDEAQQSAPAAAERAAATILSYDYTSLDTDEKSAERYMTPAYAKQYATTFDKLVRPNASHLHAKVQADVRASGVTHADPDRAAVLLFVNQTTTSTANEGQPQRALNRVQMSMVKQGGTWLVDNITSY